MSPWLVFRMACWSAMDLLFRRRWCPPLCVPDPRRCAKSPTGVAGGGLPKVVELGGNPTERKIPPMGIRKKKTLIEQAADYVEQRSTPARRAGGRVSPGQGGAAPRRGSGPAVPVIEDARDRAKPMIADGAAIAAEKASQVADVAQQKAAEGRDLAAAKVAELKGEPPKKKHRFRKVVLFGGLAAAAAFVASKLRGGQDSANWNSSYTPTPPPAPPAPPAPRRRRRRRGRCDAGRGPLRRRRGAARGHHARRPGRGGRDRRRGRGPQEGLTLPRLLRAAHPVPGAPPCGVLGVAGEGSSVSPLRRGN